MNMRIQHFVFPTLYIGTWLIIMFLLPKEVFYSGTGFLRWVVYGIIFFILPYLLYKSIKKTGLSQNMVTAITFASVVLGIPFAILLGFRAESELLDHGTRTKGIVTKAWKAQIKSRQDQWLVQAKYLVDNQYYLTSSKNDDHRTLIVGDTVTVIYSQQTPQLSEIEQLINK
ncbi:MAG: hypothetical protein ACJAUD_002583 [Crocinitomicaceae bacterium]|jgi:hypothetical protein